MRSKCVDLDEVFIREMFLNNIQQNPKSWLEGKRVANLNSIIQEQFALRYNYNDWLNLRLSQSPFSLRLHHQLSVVSSLKSSSVGQVPAS